MQPFDRWLAGLIASSLLAVGCGMLEPQAGLACQQPRDLPPPAEGVTDVLPGLRGMAPAAADRTLRAADAQGVSWRYHYATQADRVVGYSECWCVPPPGGSVEQAEVTEDNQIIVFVRGEPVIGGRAQPVMGWGCDDEAG